MPVTLDDTIECKSIVIRDENTIIFENQNFLKYCLGNGERVSRYDIVAKCFNNRENATYSAELDEINSELESYKKEDLGGISGRNLSFINKEINNEVRNISLNYEYFDIYKLRKKITNLLNERENILGNGSVYSERIKYLNSKKSELEKIINFRPQNIVSPYSGYFVNKTDGYERALNFEEIENLEYENMKYEDILKNQYFEKNAIGKIIKSTKWYLLCYVSERDIYDISKNLEVGVKFACEGDYIPAKIEKVVKNKNTGESIIILSCEYMGSTLCLTRFENIIVKKSSYFGFKIPKESLHLCKDDKATYGVYVKVGTSLVFKKINILYSGDNFVISDSFKSDEESNEKRLTNGDMVVVYGKDLHDGKCVL